MGNSVTNNFTEKLMKAGESTMGSIERRYDKYIKAALSEIPEEFRPSVSRLGGIAGMFRPPKPPKPLPSGEIVVLTYFVNSFTTVARIIPRVFRGVLRWANSQILAGPFEIWDGYSHFEDFSIGISIYESDSPLPDNALITLMRGVLESDINDKFKSSDKTGANLLKIEAEFEAKFNELMATLGLSGSYIPNLLQPVAKFRECLPWWWLQGSTTDPRVWAVELENAKIELSGYGYNDLYTQYFKKVDGSSIQLTQKNGKYYEEVEDIAKKQYITGSTDTDPSTLLATDNGIYISCSAHYNWIHFSLSQTWIKSF